MYNIDDIIKKLNTTFITIVNSDKYFNKKHCFCNYSDCDIFFPDSDRNISETLITILKKNYYNKEIVKQINYFLNIIVKNNNTISIELLFNLFKQIGVLVIDVSSSFRNFQVTNNKYEKFTKNLINQEQYNINITNIIIYIFECRTIISEEYNFFLGYCEKQIITQELVVNYFHYYLDEFNMKIRVNKFAEQPNYKDFYKKHKNKINFKKTTKSYIIIDIETVPIKKNTISYKKNIEYIQNFVSIDADIVGSNEGILEQMRILEKRPNTTEEEFNQNLQQDNIKKEIENNFLFERIIYLGMFYCNFTDLKLMEEHNITIKEIFQFKKNLDYKNKITKLINNKDYIINDIANKIIIQKFNNDEISDENREKLISVFQEIVPFIDLDNIIVYSINGSRFDHIILHSFIVKLYNQKFNRRIKLKEKHYFYANKCLYKFQINFKFILDNKIFRFVNFEFRDFTKLCTGSLYDNCKMFNISTQYFKMKEENFSIVDFRKKYNLNIVNENDEQNLIKYLLQDLISTAFVIKNFLIMMDSVEISNKFILTIGSLSIACMLKYLCVFNILINNNINCHLYFRRAYFGGRVYCLKPAFNCESFVSSMKQGQIHCYDVNSLYAYCMMINNFPIGKYIYYKSLNNTTIKTMLEKETLFICTAKLKKNNNNIKLNTMFTRVKNINNIEIITLKPVDIWYDRICSIDLYEMILNGYDIVNIEDIFVWEKKAKIFEQYVYDFYNKRLEFKINYNNIQYIYKLILNASYGKFGQKVNKRRRMIRIKNNNTVNNKFIYSFNFYKYEIIDAYCDQNVDFPIEIAIFITAYTRKYMNFIFNKLNVFNNSDYLYYSDTDSFFVNDDGKKILEQNQLICSKTIGKLKHEYSMDFALFISPKTYYLESCEKTIKKAKGIKSISTISKFDFIDLIVKGKSISVIDKNFSIKQMCVTIHNIEKSIMSVGPQLMNLNKNTNCWYYN